MLFCFRCATSWSNNINFYIPLFVLVISWILCPNIYNYKLLVRKTTLWRTIRDICVVKSLGHYIGAIFGHTSPIFDLSYQLSWVSEIWHPKNPNMTQSQFQLIAQSVPSDRFLPAARTHLSRLVTLNIMTLLSKEQLDTWLDWKKIEAPVTLGNIVTSSASLYVTVPSKSNETGGRNF